MRAENVIKLVNAVGRALYYFSNFSLDLKFFQKEVK